MLPFIIDTFKLLFDNNTFMFFSGLLLGFFITRWYLHRYFFKNISHIIICKKASIPSEGNLYIYQVRVIVNYNYKIVDVKCNNFDIITKTCLKDNKPCPFYNLKYKV
jgi:hypothetical protein